MLKKHRLRIIISYIAVLIYFGIDRSIEYATDSYAALMMDDNWKVKVYENGRVLQGLLYYIIEQFHFSSGIKYQISYLSGFIFLGLSIIILSLIISEYVKNDILSIILSFICIVNPFFVDFFLFIEKGMFCFVIFLNACAVYITNKLFSDNKGNSFFSDKKIISALIILACLLVSVLMYQTLISVYVVLCLPIIALNPDRFIVKNMFVGLMYVLPMAIAFVLAKFVFPVDRLAARDGFYSSLKAVAGTIYDVCLGKFSYLSKGIFTLYLILLFVCIGAFQTYINNHPLKHCLYLAYVIIGCTVVSFGIVFFNDSAVAPRVIYSFGYLFGIVLLYIMSNIRADMTKSAFSIILKGSYSALIMVLLITEFIIFQKCFIERYRCNQNDLYLSNIIGEKIKEYEETSGNTVDTLCYYSDMSRSWQDPGFDKTDSSTRAGATGWSRTYSINYYLGTEYVEGEPDEKMLAYFKTVNWDTLSDKQFVFEKNKLHICIY
ncbi:glucosyltransferase domain-containing protein [Butyrivibrio sp. JL13D10]|uniref:glucosyltransferase domain-containing protein n=1 Tax=Butyrivibrio sp. JL13D10 TaxID=3236815 RepID=UPI0038B528A2